MKIHRATCDCGFSGDYKSDAKAWSVLRQHKCQRSNAERLYTRRWQRERAQGQLRTVDSTEARNHIIWLRNCGMSRGHIAKLAQLSRTQAYRIEREPSCRAWVAEAILAVQPGQMLTASETFVPAVGARRRVQALLYLGHRYQDMEECIEGDITLASVVLAAGRWITARNHDRIDVMYRHLREYEGTSNKTRTIAKNRGYVPPAAWPDNTIDDPEAQPVEVVEVSGPAEIIDEVAIERFIRGDTTVTLTRPERIAAVLLLSERGRTTHEIGVVMHMNHDRVRQILTREKAA